jgi:peptidoglycan/xylan/chitin deacetylase (PgdA/CDA1 family)
MERFMLNSLARSAAAALWMSAGQTNRNRRQLAGGRFGLRSVTFHDTYPDDFSRFRSVVDWISSSMTIATPDDADHFFDGSMPVLERDRLLITFDDGLYTNYVAAKHLADLGIRAIFFVVPSFIGRTVSQYVDYHHNRGVEAYPLGSLESESRGLSRSQLHEIVAMGHRVAAHNYAHRDLGKLNSTDDITYEIDNALDSLNQELQSDCKDFAFAFGQPANLSPGAVARLRTLELRVFACFRGLNVPGENARFLMRHGFEYRHPSLFTRASLLGAADHSVADRQRWMLASIDPLAGRPQQASEEHSESGFTEA